MIMHIILTFLYVVEFSTYIYGQNKHGNILNIVTPSELPIGVS